MASHHPAQQMALPPPPPKKKKKKTTTTTKNINNKKKKTKKKKATNSDDGIQSNNRWDRLQLLNIKSKEALGAPKIKGTYVQPNPAFLAERATSIELQAMSPLATTSESNICIAMHDKTVTPLKPVPRDIHFNSGNSTCDPKSSTEFKHAAGWTIIEHKMRPVLFFFVSTLMIGLVLLAAKSLVYFRLHEISVEAIWWWSAPMAELLFYIVLLTWLASFALQASGNYQTQQQRMRNYALLSFGFGMPALLLLTVPSLRVSQTPVYFESGNVNRDQCKLVCDLLRDIPELAVACPAIAADTGSFYAIPSINDPNIPASQAEMIDIIFAIDKTRNVLASAIKNHGHFKGHYEIEEECAAEIISDAMCMDLFRKCRKRDCSRAPKDCTTKGLQTIIRKAANECVEPVMDQMNKMDEKETRKSLFHELQIILFGAGLARYMGFASEYELKLAEFTSGVLEDANALLDSDDAAECPHGWNENYSTYLCNMTYTAGQVGSRRTMCDPLLTKYERYSSEAVSVQIEHDGSLLLACTTLYFTTTVFLLAKSSDAKPISNYVAKTRVHKGGHLAGVLMGACMYMAAVQLQWTPGAEDSSQLFSVWSAVYFSVSFLCFYSSLVLLLPNFSFGASMAGHDSSEPKNCTWSTPAMKAFMSIKRRFWDPGGDFFHLKILIFEVLEVVVQLNSMMNSAGHSEARLVILSIVILSSNLVIMPIVVILAQMNFPTSPSYVEISAIFVEVMFDQILVAVAIFFRFDSLIEKDLSIADQLSRHLGVIIPALATFLDISDVISLEKISKMDQQLGIKNEVEASEGCGRQCMGIQSVCRQYRLQVKVMQVFLYACSILTGVALVIHALLSYSLQVKDCVERIGPLAMCTSPNVYFADGLFAPSRCAFEKVEEINCQGIASDGSNLPNAIEEYSQMINLRVINVSHSELLESVPRAWSVVPNSSLVIDLDDNVNFSGLPYEICSGSNRLASIHLKNTKASRYLDWNKQILLAGDKRFSLNSACLKELSSEEGGRLEFLSLAENNLTAASFDTNVNFGETFKSLRVLNLSQNSIRELYVSRMPFEKPSNSAKQDHPLRHDHMFSTFLRRICPSDSPEEEMLVSNQTMYMNSTSGFFIHGNPIEKVFFTWLPYDILQIWVNLLQYLKLDSMVALSIDTCTFSSFEENMFSHGSLANIKELTLRGMRKKVANFDGPYDQLGLSRDSEVCLSQLSRNIDLKGVTMQDTKRCYNAACSLLPDENGTTCHVTRCEGYFC